jgi:DNA-binding transcriptional MocR family regulator
MPTERENVCLENSVQGCLESIGISLISEWDMLAFVYRHGPSLTSTEQIAKLIGYESGTVGAALARLEGQKLIERLGPTKGVRLHKMRAHAGHQRCLLRLVSLSESRAGRLLLKKILKPVEPGTTGDSSRTGPESEGKRND